jgi:hypothetical protein
MLLAPRELLALAPLPLKPLEPPLNPLLAPLLFGTLRLPILLCPALELRLAALAPLELRPALLALGLLALRLALLALGVLGRELAALRLTALCEVALGRAPEPDWPRAVAPEYLLAVDLLEYGAAPRCWEL